MLTQPTPVSVGFFCLKSRSSANIPEIVQRSATRQIFPVARRRNRISRSLFIFLTPYWRHEKTTRLHASRNPDCDADRRGAWCIWAVWLAALAAATAAVADRLPGADYLLQLREDANWRNRDHVINVLREGGTWCLASSATSRASCQPVSPLIFAPLWADVEMADITPSLAFFGLRNTAWAGHIRLKNAAGEWRVVVSGWGRIRLCERDEARLCQ